MHVHSALDGGIGATPLVRMEHLPLVLTEHSSALGRRLVPRWKLPFVGAAYRAADRLIAVSPALGEQLEARFPSAFTDWHWIPNIVAPEFFETPPSDLRPGPARILSLGALLANKGHADLVRAFALAFPQDEARLRIGGAGPEGPALEALVRELGLGQRVTLLGYLDRSRVVEEMRQADLFALPSHYETFGVVAAEALALGTPVVATRCGGPEAVVSAEDGWLVPPGDVPALARALRQATGSEMIRHRAAIRERARARFGPNAVVARLEEVYADLDRAGPGTRTL